MIMCLEVEALPALLPQNPHPPTVTLPVTM